MTEQADIRKPASDDAIEVKDQAREKGANLEGVEIEPSGEAENRGSGRWMIIGSAMVALGIIAAFGLVRRPETPEEPVVPIEEPRAEPVEKPKPVEKKSAYAVDLPLPPLRPAKAAEPDEAPELENELGVDPMPVMIRANKDAEREILDKKPL